MLNHLEHHTFQDTIASLPTLLDADHSVHHTFQEAATSVPALPDADQEDPLLNVNEATVLVHLRPHQDPKELTLEEI